MYRMICRNCNRLVLADRFCSNCGALLVGETSEGSAKERSILKEIQDVLNRLSQQAPTPGQQGQAPIPDNALEVYLEYKVLRVDNLAAVLSSLDNIYKIVYGIQANVTTSGNERVTEEYIEKVQELLRGNPQDDLQVESVHTGNSIKIRVTNGWKPSVSWKSSDLILTVPKGFHVLLLTASLLGAAANYSIDSVGGLYDVQIKRIELKLKERELKEAERKELEMEREAVEKINKVAPALKESLGDEVRRFLDATTRNNEVTGVQVAVGTEKTGGSQ